VIGAALAVSLLAAWTVSGGTRAVPASVTIVADRSNDLDLRSVVVPQRHATLAPASPALEWALTARNATASALVVRIRAVPQDAALDGALALRVRTRGATIFTGRLRDLRLHGSDAFPLASHKMVRVQVDAWMPTTARGYGARVESILLRFLTEAPR